MAGAGAGENPHKGDAERREGESFLTKEEDEDDDENDDDGRDDWEDEAKVR